MLPPVNPSPILELSALSHKEPTGKASTCLALVNTHLLPTHNSRIIELKTLPRRTHVNVRTLIVDKPVRGKLRSGNISMSTIRITLLRYVRRNAVVDTFLNLQRILKAVVCNHLYTFDPKRFLSIFGNGTKLMIIRRRIRHVIINYEVVLSVHSCVHVVAGLYAAAGLHEPALRIAKRNLILARVLHLT